jgi:hypothetical protein
MSRQEEGPALPRRFVYRRPRFTLLGPLELPNALDIDVNVHERLRLTHLGLPELQ